MKLETSTPTLFYHLLHFCIKFLFAKQLFQCQMHSVAPEISRICRNINSFGMWIFESQFFIHRHPVLPRQNHQHRIRLQVLFYNFFCDQRRTHFRCRSLQTQCPIIKALRKSIILFPPGTYRVHIVCRCSAN